MFLRQIARDFFAPRPTVGALMGRGLAHWPVRAAQTAEIAGESVVPHLHFRNLIYRALDGLEIEPFDDTVSVGDVCLADIAGCTASREADPSFAAIVAQGGDEGTMSAAQADALARTVLTRDARGVTEAGRRVTVIRQSWDGQMRLSNIDASHRTAALWNADRAAGRRRMIADCEIIDKTPSTALQALLRVKEIWLLSSHEFPAALPYEAMRDVGIDMRALNPYWLAGTHEGDIYRLIVPRAVEGFDAIAARLPPQAALSAMVAFLTVPYKNDASYKGPVNGAGK